MFPKIKRTLRDKPWEKLRTAAASLAPQESPVTVDKWSVSFSHVVLIAGLRPELSR